MFPGQVSTHFSAPGQSPLIFTLKLNLLHLEDGRIKPKLQNIEMQLRLALQTATHSTLCPRAPSAIIFLLSVLVYILNVISGKKGSQYRYYKSHTDLTPLYL